MTSSSIPQASVQRVNSRPNIKQVVRPFSCCMSCLLVLSRECGNEPRGPLKGNHKGWSKKGLLSMSHSLPIAPASFPTYEIYVLVLPYTSNKYIYIYVYICPSHKIRICSPRVLSTFTGGSACNSPWRADLPPAAPPRAALREARKICQRRPRRSSGSCDGSAWHCRIRKTRSRRSSSYSSKKHKLPAINEEGLAGKTGLISSKREKRGAWQGKPPNQREPSQKEKIQKPPKDQGTPKREGATGKHSSKNANSHQLINRDLLERVAKMRVQVKRAKGRTQQAMLLSLSPFSQKEFDIRKIVPSKGEWSKLEPPQTSGSMLIGGWVTFFGPMAYQSRLPPLSHVLDKLSACVLPFIFFTLGVHDQSHSPA